LELVKNENDDGMNNALSYAGWNKTEWEHSTKIIVSSVNGLLRSCLGLVVYEKQITVLQMKHRFIFEDPHIKKMVVSYRLRPPFTERLECLFLVPRARFGLATKGL